MNAPTDITSSDHNPFAAPQSAVEADASSDWKDAERIRHAHLSHEASVKSIGSVFLIAALICGAFSFLIYSDRPIGGPARVAEQFTIMAIFIVIGLFLLLISIALIRLRPWVRVPAMILSAMFVFVIPIGTLLAPYFLYLLICKKGETVLSAAYRKTISQTPHIKYRTPVAGWAILGVLVLSILALGVFTMGW